MLKAFNARHVKNECFAGIAADLEPHIMKAGHPSRPAGLDLVWSSEYGIGGDNDLLEKRAVEVMGKAKDLLTDQYTLNQAVGFFVQQKVDMGLLQWGAADQYLKYCDWLVVMAYNYRPERSLEMASYTLKAAGGSPKSVSIALKTSLNTLGDDGPTTSLQPQGWAYMINAIKYIVDGASKYDAFRGIDIFEYNGLEVMLEGKAPLAPVAAP